jgi:CheY-like chemotaxis protein
MKIVKVLFVDANSFLRDSAAELLVKLRDRQGRSYCEVSTCDDLSSALSAFDMAAEQGCPFDVVSSGLNLSIALDGLYLLRLIRAKSPETLVLLSSSIFKSSVLDEASLEGIPCVTKPDIFKPLVVMIEKIRDDSQ